MRHRDFFRKTKKMLLATAFSVSLLGLNQPLSAQTITANTQSTQNGWFYSFWNDNASGSASMTLGAGGNYSTKWTNVGNFTAGKGWATGSATRVICFDGTFDGGNNGYLAIYGWTKNELIEYYVVENYGSWTPPGGTSLGSFDSDGGTYKVYKTQRVQQPSIIGTATFYQYWSVRTTKRSKGTVTFANHVAAWKSFGMNMGTTWDYQILESEGYQSSGSSNVTISECSTPTGPTVTLTAPTGSITVPAGTAITLTATATVLTGATVSKVEFLNGTALLNSDATAPYTYSWTPTAAGTYTITAKVTDNGGKTATSSEITVTVVEPLKIYKTPTAITVDGTADAIWANASVLPASAAKVLSGTVSNSADLSGTFKALWDNTYLYILADITDDTKKNDSQNSYDDDGIEVYIDGDNAKASTYDANDVQYSFGWNDGTTIGTIPSTYSKTGISYVTVDKTGGYIVEARIPWTTLQVTPATSKVIGIDFMINDDDDGSGRDAKLAWNAATDDAWENASLFGIGVLSDVLSAPCTPPSAPTVVSPVNYAVGATASPLTATGTGLLWYTAATGGTGSATAPTPSTTTVGTTSYFVSQTVSSCEGARAEIVVSVTKPAAKVSLVAGWNIVGCPITGSTEVSSAMASIWANVLSVKNLDSFYLSTNPASLNSLKNVQWGQGYMVKVSKACELDWIAK